jgi:hypothetical protein
VPENFVKNWLLHSAPKFSGVGDAIFDSVVSGSDCIVRGGIAVAGECDDLECRDRQHDVRRRGVRTDGS